MTMTMRHRVALAICQHAILNCCWRKTGENIEASKQCASCGSATSFVLKAMREPTPAMTAIHNSMGGNELCWDADAETAANVWRAMIDAALKETQ